MSDRLWPLYSLDELADLPQPQWLVENTITDGLSVMYGPPGSAKTFLALAWALAVASGERWLGKQTVKSPVLYVSGEGGGGLANRIEAWRLHNLVPSSSLAVYMVLGTVRLTEHDHVLALARDIHAIGAKLLVVDTLARSMAGADENSAQDMGIVVQSLDWIRRKTGCASLVVHHCGVEKTRPRGSTALFGAADTVIRVTDESGTIHVVCEKQKEAPRFRPVGVRLVESGDSVVLDRAARALVGYLAGEDD